MNKKQVVIKSNRKSFFRYWMTLTKPFHKLRPKEQELLASFIYYFYEYKVKINDDRLAWKMVFDYDTKLLIKSDLNDMKDSVLQNLMTSLRKSKALVTDGYEKVNSAYIPKIDIDAKRFDLTFTILINETINKTNKEDSKGE